MNFKSLVLTTGIAVTGLVASGAVAPAQASTFTNTSPTSQGLLPGAVSTVGGVVVDLIGLNGARVVTQTAASGLYQGFSGAGVNPLTFGTQSGFTPSVIAALGGGISQASVRISLYDGDSGSGDFDFNENTLLLNGFSFGNFSAVATENTDSTGTQIAGGFSAGFRDNLLDTGFFFSNDAGTLASLYTSLSGGSIAFSLTDVDPNDNFYDFQRGIDNSLVNVGNGPIVTPGGQEVPEPFTIVGTLVGGSAALRMRKNLKSSTKA
jgi:hypothetical protein